MVANDCVNGNLPYDVMINILKRLPIKSLLRFKCVVKEWYNLFKSPYFISLHLHHSTPFLLFKRIHKSNHQSQSSSSLCLIGPDFKVHNHQFIDFPSQARVIGSCNGLLCVKQTGKPNLLSIWNPATREIRQVPTGTLICSTKSFCWVGYGFSPVVNDYKVVRILIDKSDNVRVSRAEVYSLTTGSWKELDATNLQKLYPISDSVTASGVMFWVATVIGFDDFGDFDGEFVVSFDIGEEKFMLLKGPPTPTNSTHSFNNVLAVHNNKLAMFHQFIIGCFESCSVDLWVLEDFVGERWVKQYSLGPFSRVFFPLSIWNDEIVCREKLPCHDNDYSMKTVLSLFNPYSNEMKNLPAHRDEYYSHCFSYAESLVTVANIHHEQ